MMSRRFPPRLWLACAILALAPASLAWAEGASVRMTAPESGAVLAAGTTAELAWAPVEPFPQFEEWEAFLSLDGGKTYPVRITPHLDRSLRRVGWQVPPTPTLDARILLRIGDERRETAVELPQRFAIVASPATLWIVADPFQLARQSATAGEPALPGHAGVVVWMEGTRRGGGLRQVVAAEQPGLQARLRLPETHEELVVLGSEPAPSPLLGAVQGKGVAPDPPAGHRAGSRAAAALPLVSDILLLIQRQNE